MRSTSLDIEDRHALVDWLRATGRLAEHEEVGTTLLGGGVSNRVVKVVRASGESWVLKQALEQLRVQAEWHCSVLRVHREALGMRWLAKLAPPGAVPRFLFEDGEHHLLAMEAVPSTYENWKEILLAGRVNPADFAGAGTLLATMHNRAMEFADDLVPIFEDRSFFDALRLEPFYEFSAERVPATGDFLRSLVLDTRARRSCLVHGDFSPKNILIDNDRMVLLDHEVIHWGDPMFDVGFFLAHALSKAHALVGRR
ncbi:MAG: phosphotransferase, partial [Verrucomicrobiales bacterium]|nr:phosphotransferase [Verrucomicrobiales bacterium]